MKQVNERPKGASLPAARLWLGKHAFVPMAYPAVSLRTRSAVVLAWYLRISRER